MIDILSLLRKVFLLLFGFLFAKYREERKDRKEVERKLSGIKDYDKRQRIEKRICKNH